MPNDAKVNLNPIYCTGAQYLVLDEFSGRQDRVEYYSYEPYDRIVVLCRLLLWLVVKIVYWTAAILAAVY